MWILDEGSKVWVFTWGDNEERTKTAAILKEYFYEEGDPIPGAVVELVGGGFLSVDAQDIIPRES